jgi:hypothetical protein
MSPQSYASGAAFRIALEARLKDRAAAEKIDLQRLRRRVAFDRLLSRLVTQDPERWALKGGYALEIQLTIARSTRDIDLVLRTPSQDTPGFTPVDTAMTFLRTSAAVDAHDFFAFAVGRPTMQMKGLPYGGARFPIESRVGGRLFLGFHLDVAVGDTIVMPLQAIVLENWLGFAGVAAATVPVISREQQFAEKLHAYATPRDGEHPNSRVKDLLDMVLLLKDSALSPADTLDTLTSVFRRRGQPCLPTTLGDPPSSWATPFAIMANECGISTDVVEACEDVRSFYRQVLRELPSRSQERL